MMPFLEEKNLFFLAFGSDIYQFSPIFEFYIQQFTKNEEIFILFKREQYTLYIFEEKYSLKNTLLNVLPYEQAS